jgi:serine/threonine protein kinase
MTDRSTAMSSKPKPPVASEPTSLAQTMSLSPVAVETSGLGAASGDTSAAKSGPLKRIGRFEVQAVLGQGAFGAVYRARDPQLDRLVAIKVPRAGVLKTAEDMHRFLREARAAATLNHPQVCPVFEVGETEGTPYIVMALVEGKTLADVLKSSKGTSDRQAATAIRKVALALEEAHRKQIIHRDLKPGNIMINRRGEPVVMDFGLARLSEPGDVQLTMSGVIMGTPAYMSPEQARGDGRVLGPSTDIYSLGVILYEMLAGRRPFEGTLTEVLASILHVEPELPSKYRSDIDLRLEAICMKAMAKKVEDRFPTMAAFATALGEYLRDANAKTPDQSSLPPMPPPLLPPSLPASELPPLASYRPTVKQHAATTKIAAPLPVAAPAVPPPVGVAENLNPPAFGDFNQVRPVVRSVSRRRANPPWLMPGLAGIAGLAVVTLVIFASRTSEPPAKAPRTAAPKPAAPEITPPRSAESPPVATAALPNAAVPVASPPGPPPLSKPGGGWGDGNAWIELFNGRDLSGWTSVSGGPATWKVADGAMEIDGPSIMTDRKFRSDFELYLEFWIAKSSGQGQRRGNSGVYLQGRHEIQIMDGFNNPEKPVASCGALFGAVGPSQNVCRPPEEWQTFDITYHGPRFRADNTLMTGRVTVIHNGVKVIDNGEFPATAGGLAVDNRVGEPGPIMLQNHGSKLRFRNLRIRELKPEGGAGQTARPSDVKTFAGHAYKFYPELLTWKQAKARCEQLGGRLAIPESLAENQFVAGLVTAAGWQDSWIGITDEAREGEWRGVDGSAIAFTNWFVKQPNNKNGDEHFALLSNRTFNEPANGRWSDQPNAALPAHTPGYVCEWDR